MLWQRVKHLKFSRISHLPSANYFFSVLYFPTHLIIPIQMQTECYVQARKHGLDSRVKGERIGLSVPSTVTFWLCVNKIVCTIWIYVNRTQCTCALRCRVYVRHVAWQQLIFSCRRRNWHCHKCLFTVNTVTQIFRLILCMFFKVMTISFSA